MSEKLEEIKDTDLKKIDQILDLDYKSPEYSESEYLYNAEWGGADKILQIEKQFDDKINPVFDKEFDVFWKFYIKNLVDFDTKANMNKKKYQQLQFIAILFTIITPQIISYMSLLDWGSIGLTSALTFLIPIPLTFITALFVSILSLKKYEQLFMNYRSSCEKLKSASFKFQFNDDPSNVERKNDFIKHVIQIVEEHLAGYEGIFAK